MNVRRVLCIGVAVLAASGLWASSANADLIVGFEFAGGATSTKVPLAGGTYVVNAYVQGGTGVNELLFAQGYFGALSEVVAGGPVIGGDATVPVTVLPTWTNASFYKPGTISEKNSDGHLDVGGINGLAKGDASWVKPSAGATAAGPAGSTKFYIGSFDVTIPANTGAAVDGAAFLKYNPQLSPSGIGLNFSWSESGTGKSGSTTSAPPSAVLVGNSVTFTASSAVPEPGTLALLAAGALGAMVWFRRRS